jgi:hypothetical protein
MKYLPFNLIAGFWKGRLSHIGVLNSLSMLSCVIQTLEKFSFLRKPADQIFPTDLLLNLLYFWMVGKGFPSFKKIGNSKFRT